MNIKSIMIIFFLSLVTGCSKKEKNTVSKCIDWINDKSGCNGVRSIEYAKNIIKTEKLQKESYDTFTEVFGAPNKIEKDSTNKMLFYYSDSSCDNGKIIQNSDKCFIIFYFKNDTFTDLSMRCE